MLEIDVQEARNGLTTCRYLEDGKWKYMYSRYKPEPIVTQVKIDENATSILILGYGLGYEVAEYYLHTKKPIYILEGHPTFLHQLKNSVHADALVELDVAQTLINNEKCQVISHNHIVKCNPEYYARLFDKKQSINKKIVVFDYSVIAKDCADAFENLGFDVTYITDDNLQEWKHSLTHEKPYFLFGVNYQQWIAQLAEKNNISYINWVVDTPNFNLYYEENKKYSKTYTFIYDEAIANDLKKKGFQNIYYLPVAANVNRLQNLELTEEEYNKYACQISFLGNPCIQNEYTQFIEPKIDETVKKIIEQLVQAQMFKDQFIIKQVITNDFARSLLIDSNLAIKQEFGTNIEPMDILSMFLGRFHSFRERIYLMKFLEQFFDLSVYGGEEWVNLVSNVSYKGCAEHYSEMPKIFKASKITLNPIRSFVESGLPMRVFDVLGSGGFLLTNSKLDIHRYFKDGHDLVIYRDEKDMFDIIKYYSEHENERLEISTNGLKNVKENHTFEIRLKSMLKILGFL